MDSAFIRRARAIFLAALDLPPAERGGFVARECGEDGALHRRVMELLRLAEDEGPRDSGAPSNGLEEGGDEAGAD